VPVFSWTGCYVGGHGGYGKGQTSQNVSFDDINRGGEYHPAYNFDNKGGVYGLQGGCNYQVGLFVAGIEGDYSWANLNESRSFVDPIEDAPNVDSATFNSKIDALASIRGRFGIAADRALVYATMGWGWANFKYSYLLNDQGVVNAAAFSTTADGVVLGAGVNYAWTNWLILRAEYLHYAVNKDIDLASSILVNTTGPQWGDRAGITNVDVVRVGLDWKFW
jgi:outer membrane immunogenic protein